MDTFVKHRFSAYWTEELGKAILAEAPDSYPMDLVMTDAEVVKAAVNQGIDSHLEACFIPAIGDSYTVTEGGRFCERRLACKVSRESLPVLVRRLMESGNEHAESLASCICETIGIELI
jgi:hypothetical protein